MALTEAVWLNSDLRTISRPPSSQLVMGFTGRVEMKFISPWKALTTAASTRASMLASTGGTVAVAAAVALGGLGRRDQSGGGCRSGG